MNQFRKIGLLLLFLVIFSIYSKAGSKTFKGIYQGKNIYVLNPFINSNYDFCVTNVLVNEQETEDDINSSSFEINLAALNIQIGGEVAITIEFQGSCEPQIINLNALKPKSTFVVTLKKIDKTHNLNWTTRGEKGKLPFIIEQYRWGKWIKVEQVMGKGDISKNTYKVKINPHTGSNKFRLKQVDYTNIPHYSRTISYRYSKPVITYEQNKATKEIIFSNETMYEIYDYKGVLIVKGINDKIDISDISPGKYYFNYDNTSEKIKIK